MGAPLFFIELSGYWVATLRDATHPPRNCIGTEKSLVADYFSDSREEDWPTEDIFMVASNFSDLVSDYVSEK